MSLNQTYGQILKSSSIVGGGAIITMFLSMVRVKFAALLIGPIGLGIMANFTAIQTLVGIVAGVGMQNSAVRDIAQAAASGSPNAMGRAVITLRRICWITGLAGATLLAVLSPNISRWTFNSDEYTTEIASLGLVILFSNIYGGQMALIQGARRVGDIARVNIVGGLAGTISALGFYKWLGVDGIVPAILAFSIASLLSSWWFSRKVTVPDISMTWPESLRAAGGMIRLGMVFMWSSLMLSLVGYATNMLVTRQISLEAVGIYSAAYAVSGVFINFVLNAMGSDYYPRLAGVADEPQKLNQLVNEQTEIGLLLAFPGVLAMLVLAPWIIQLLYSPKFLPASTLLQWFVLGCLIRVIQWPMGYLQQAMGKGRWLFFTQTTLNALHFGLIVAGLELFGLEGVAIAFFAVYVVALGVIKMVARRLTGFRWSDAARRLILTQAVLAGAVFAVVHVFPTWLATILGSCVVAMAAVYSLRGIAARVGSTHRVIRLASRVPGFTTLMGTL